MFPDSKIAQSYSCGRTKASAMSKTIADHFSCDLVNKLRTQPFSISTDGSNDGGASQIYPLVVRFFDRTKGAVVTQLLSIVECVGNSTGENIFNMLHEQLSKFSIPLKNVKAFCCDNASVMLGVHKGVVKFIKDHNPNVYINGCAFHLLHLAAKAGSKELHKDMEEILVDIYHFLDKSTKRQKGFQKFQMECAVNLNKILKHGATRWLSLESCNTRMLEQWVPLQLYFQSEFDSLTDIKKKSSKFERIKRVYSFLSDQVCRLYCLFRRDALPLFTKCNLALQHDSPQFHTLRQRFHKLFTDLMVKFVRTSAITKCNNIYQIEHSLKKNLVPRDELKIGTDARSLLIELKAEGKISTSDEDRFVTDVRNFYSSSLAYIIAKFPLDDKVLNNANVLYVRQRAKVAESSVIFFNDRFKIIPKVQQESLLLEFSKYKLESFPDEVIEEESVDKQWHAIGKTVNMDNKAKFPLLQQLMESILCIPHSNADSDRIFSMVRKNHTEFRSSMNTDTLSSIMTLKTHMLANEKVFLSPWRMHS